MEKKANKPFHYGFALAKIFMCFEVVLCHFWYEQEYSILLQPFKEIGSSAVPVFALIYAIVQAVVEYRLTLRGLPTETKEYRKDDILRNPPAKTNAKEN